MLKTLLKKQAIETLSIFTFSGKKGEKRKPLAVVAFAVLILYAFVASAVMFYGMAKLLCTPLVSVGMDWVYFALMGSIAFSLSCVMGAFVAKAKLFEAKDNDLLLSMPVKPSLVLFARMVGVYGYNLLFIALTFIPATVHYFVATGFSFSVALICLGVTLLLPLCTLAISALLGWLFAFVSAKLRWKNLLTYILIGAFLVAYFYLSTKVNEYLEWILTNGEALSGTFSGVFPLRWLGKACAGNGLEFLYLTGFIAVVFGLVYLLIAKTFLNVATAKIGEQKKTYKEKIYKDKEKSSRGGAPVWALVKKEALRTVKSPMVLVNAGIGSMLLLIVSVVAILNTSMLRELLLAFGDKGYAIACAVVCFVCACNTLTSSSVSLEGENIWILQSSPVSAKTVFLAKVLWQVLYTAIPALICSVVLFIVLQILVLTALAFLLVVCVAVVCFSLFGLTANLTLPNLNWTNEMVAVKQSISVLVGMFGEIGLCALLVGGYFLFGKFLPAWGYLLICFAFFAVLTVVLCLWIKKKGTKIWENL